MEGKGQIYKDIREGWEERMIPPGQKPGPSWAVRGQPAWPLPWCCQYQPPGRRRPRGEGSWAKGMEDFQSSLAQLFIPPKGALRKGL